MSEQQQVHQTAPVPSGLDTPALPKHTPGPWQIQTFRSHRDAGFVRRVFTDRIEIFQGNSARLIACMHLKNWSIGGEGDMANARLLVAAPDLLAALQVLIEAPTFEAYRQQARAAIAKATGAA